MGATRKMLLLGAGAVAAKAVLDTRRKSQLGSSGPYTKAAAVRDTPTGTDPNAKYATAGFEDKSIGQAVNQDAELSERLVAESDGDEAEAERRFMKESAGAPKLRAQEYGTDAG